MWFILNIEYEILVVDNDSADGSLEKLIQDFKNESLVKFIKNTII